MKAFGAGICERAFDDYIMPRLSRLQPNLVAGAFYVMKLLPARAILDAAVAEGKLKPGYEVFESTSGTFGLALALLAKEYGYRLTLVSDPVIDPMLEMRLKELDARVEIVHNKIAGGYQLARLERLNALMAESPDSFFTYQYENPHNALGYAPLAHYLVEKLGEFDCLVGTVGTGGSMCGTARALRRLLPQVEIVGVDTPNSVIFGQPNGERHLRGLGNSLVSSNVEHSLFNTVHWVDAAEAYLATRELHKAHGLYMGGTSGAAWLVADWIAQQNPQKRVVCLLPDEGYRYQHTIYNDKWLHTVPNWKESLPDAPHLMQSPTEKVHGWGMVEWNRRSLKDMLALPVAA